MPVKDNEDDLLTQEEFAALARVNPQTPAQWRKRGTGPKWLKLGDGPTSPIRYKRSDIREWLATRYGDTTPESV